MLELIHTQKEPLNQLALLLYRKGMSSRDVSEVMEAYFGQSISRDTVNNLAESFHSLRKQWQEVPLELGDGQLSRPVLREERAPRSLLQETS
ncbi:MAG: transposase, partial [Cytophagales bacterium]|nr:transposase [Cytophagales bacterium]